MKTTEACHYCEKGAARKGSISCSDCTFECPECRAIFGYENGHGDCQSCDWCCIKHGEEHVPYNNYWRGK